MAFLASSGRLPRPSFAAARGVGDARGVGAVYRFAAALLAGLAMAGAGGCAAPGLAPEARTASAAAGPAKETPARIDVSVHSWRAEIGRDHPLAGRIWAVRAQRFATPDELEAALRAAPGVLLGETHDNPDHHRLRLELLRAFPDLPDRLTLAMEQLDREWQAQIAAAIARGGATSATVAEAAEVKRSGWDWPFYAPFVDLALERGWRLVAANLSRAQARDVAKQGFGALGPGRAEMLRVETVWTAERETALRAEIVDSHCGVVDQGFARTLAQAQRARDAVIAEALAASPTPRKVLIAGNGHVRRDRGVPLYLGGAAAGERSADVVVAFVEVDADRTGPAEYAAARAGDPPNFDYVWFTPAAKRKDPCAEIRSRGKL
jgi:uncharacterized iron-regulated protein